MNDSTTTPPSAHVPRPTQPDTASHSSSDADQLRLLSIFHYILGGLTLLMCAWPVLQLVIGISLMVESGNVRNGQEQFVGGAFITGIASVFIIAGATLGGFFIHAGRCLARQRRYTMCMVMACISCMLMPFGTVLGVFTLIILLRPSVKALFEANA